jgi:hypothetical protein
MPLSIAEYLGQRTDVDEDIIPSILGGKPVPSCDFLGGPCSKLNSSRPQHPVCSVRMHGGINDGKLFVVCSDRLIPAKSNKLSQTQIAALGSISRVLFPEVSVGAVGYKRQMGIRLGKSTVYLDYVLQVDPSESYQGRVKKVILEIQGGGETSNTGTITRHIANWATEEQTNDVLSQILSTEYLRKITGKKTPGSPGIIPNNAWKRQLDQIIKKAPLAMHYGGSFAIVMGEVLYDYFAQTFPAGKPYFPEWEIAFIGMSESSSTQRGAIPIDKVTKSIFMTYEDFFEALKAVRISRKTIDPFLGEFQTLRNSTFRV